MTTAAATLTATDLEAGYHDERWLGWGYLGERSRALDAGQHTQVVAADGALLTAATERGWDYEALFAFANSRPGRWFGDVAFGGPVTADQLARAATSNTAIDLD